MLGGMSIEEYMAQEGIPLESEASEDAAKPPPKEPEMERISATPEQVQALEDAFGPGKGLFGSFGG